MNKKEQELYDKLVETINLLQDNNANQQRRIEELESQIEQYQFEQKINEGF